MELDRVGTWCVGQNTQHASVHPLALSPHRAGLFSVYSLSSDRQRREPGCFWFLNDGRGTFSGIKVF